MDTGTPCLWGVLPLVIGTPFVVFVLLFGWTYLHPYYKNNPIIIIPLILIIILVLILVNNVFRGSTVGFYPLLIWFGLFLKIQKSTTTQKLRLIRGILRGTYSLLLFCCLLCYVWFLCVVCFCLLFKNKTQHNTHNQQQNNTTNQKLI